MTQDAPDHFRVVDKRDQLETIPAARTREHVEAKLRCISSAHSQFARDGIGVARDDDSTAVVPRSRAIAVSGSRACRRDRHADRAPSTP
jgi:hypothetical protein